MIYKNKIKNLACLVPDKSKINKNSFYMTSHEKTLCDCEVLQIVKELEQQLKQKDERLEKAEEVIGFYAGEDVACVIYELDDSNSPYIYESSKEGNSIMGTKARKYQQKYMSEDSDE